MMSQNHSCIYFSLCTFWTGMKDITCETKSITIDCINVIACFEHDKCKVKAIVNLLISHGIFHVQKWKIKKTLQNFIKKVYMFIFLMFCYVICFSSTALCWLIHLDTFILSTCLLFLSTCCCQ